MEKHIFCYVGEQFLNIIYMKARLQGVDEWLGAGGGTINLNSAANGGAIIRLLFLPIFRY